MPLPDYNVEDELCGTVNLRKFGGDGEVHLGAKEKSFVCWAESEGYERGEILMVIGEQGLDSNIAVYDAWPVWQAAWEAASA